ncbi:hypothetical protein CTI12_AA386630 [Artemisia annua]|uniref:Uncharacterized protein n=1 Tax=Artemisia annua TaxID=35608 RepID=A0A2U1MFI5_ARTAN|nr:hypothetical protein CTI12_AA386630 [Artemisia annua]
MTTARDTPPPYETTASAGGKLRKTPLRRRNTPYARPPTAIRNNKNPNLLTKIVDPASRLLYAGANKLFGAVFGNRNMFLPLQRPSEINEEPQNVPREEGQHGNSASISVATGISDLEQMLQQKTFTRSEIERLTALLHSRTNESSSADVVERDGANPYSSPSSLLRLEESTSGSLQKHGDERDNLHAAISTPMVTSRVLEEDIASPAQLAKAYMGSRPTKVAPRQDIVLHNNATGFSNSPIAPKIANGSTGFENGFTTPRSRGRSAMYSMARTPYARSPTTFTQKGITSSYGRDEAFTSSQSAFQHGGKMALKRRSSVLDDDIGSGGPLRRTRQKANLLTLRDKRELGYTALQQPDHGSQKLPLMNESEPKVVKGAEENRYTSMHGTGSVSGYANVPTKSTQTATKILQHLEKPSPKEKSSGSTKSPTKLTLDMLHGQALRSLEKVDSPKLLSYPHDNQKSEVQHHERIHDSRELTSKGKEKVEDNGSRKFPIPRSMMTLVNGELSDTSKDKAPAIRINEPTAKLTAEPPQKKRAFQMSAPEDDSFEVDDDDDEIQTNGHMSLPLVENNKQETALPADIVATSILPGVSRTPALVENNKQMFPEVVKVPEQAVPKEAEKPVSSPKTDVGFGGSVSEQGLGFKLPVSPPLTTNTQNNLLPQSTLQMDNVALKKDSNSFQLFGTSAERASPFAFSANGLSDSKPSASSDPKALESTSVSNSVTANGHVKLPESDKVENGNDQKSANIFGKVESNKTESGSDQQPANIFGKSESNKDGNGNDQKAANIFGKLDAPPSAALPATPTNGIFSFGTSTNNVNTTPNTTPLSKPTTFPSVVPFTASSATTSSLFNFSSPNVSSTSIASTAATTTVISTTTTPTPAAIFSTSTPAPVIPSSVPAPVFSFGSATSTAPTISVAETGNTNVTNDKDLKSNLTNSPFASTPFATTPTTTTGSGLFGFSSPAATSTTNNQSQASFFNVSNGSQANTQASMAVTSSVPFLFGSGTTSIQSSTSGTSPFSSSAPAIGTSSSFGVGSMTASSEGKSGNSTSGPTTSVFGSTWEPAKSSGFGTPFNFGASATPTPSATTSPVVFGASNTGSSTGFSFGAGAGATTSSFSTPTQNQSPFGNPTPVFGTGATANNNDHMSMDSMAEDSMQTPTPVPAFGQTPVASPGFMFGSATPTPTPAPSPAMPSFQFGGHRTKQYLRVQFRHRPPFNLVANQTKQHLRILSSRLVSSLMLEVGASH